MSEENEALVRAAYQAYGQGDMTGMLALVHPDLEWTYLDPAFGDPSRRPAMTATSCCTPWSARPRAA